MKACFVGGVLLLNLSLCWFGERLYSCLTSLSDGLFLGTRVLPRLHHVGQLRRRTVWRFFEILPIPISILLEGKSRFSRCLGFGHGGGEAVVRQVFVVFHNCVLLIVQLLLRRWFLCDALNHLLEVSYSSVFL